MPDGAIDGTQYLIGCSMPGMLGLPLPTGVPS